MPKIKDLRIKAPPQQVMQAIVKGGVVRKPKNRRLIPIIGLHRYNG